jgi:hypothetical protein
MEDRELYRFATLLERLAYEEDVRKIIRNIVRNNEVEERAEQGYLNQRQREHSQKVIERGMT